MSTEGPRTTTADRASLGRFGSLRQDWDELAEAAGNVFLTREWAETWWELHGGRHRLAIQPHAVGGRVRAILPLYAVVARPVPVFRFIGHGPADELGPLCAPEHREEALDALRRFLARTRGILVGERLPGATEWRTAIGARCVRSEPAPLLRMEGRAWDEWLATKSAHFRERIRSNERRLKKRHETRFRMVTTAGEELEQGLQTLLDLHHARWGEDSRAFRGKRREMHLAFARRAAARGWLRLWLADLDGKTVAALLNYRVGDVEWGLQGGRDPEWERSSAGSVLLTQVARSCFEDGIREFRLGRGDQTFKDRLASEDPCVDTVVAGPSIIPWMAGAGAELARRVPKEPRRALKQRLNV